MPRPYDLSGRSILILGGAGSMGQATARLALELGAEVNLFGRSRRSLDAAAARLSAPASRLRTFEGDATQADSVERVLASVGPVDHIVVATSSGTPHVQPPFATIPLVSPETAKAVYSRLWAAYTAVHVAPRHVRPGGSVTLISGASGRRPQAGWGIYGALHGAIETLGKAAAIELAPLRVNVVSPGCVGGKPIKQLTHHYGRFEDLAAAVIALITNPAITSALLDVDGGESLGDWNGKDGG